jgi:hypothetical protein
MSIVSNKLKVRKSKIVNRKFQIREISIARSGMTKQSTFTLVGLLHLIRNDMIPSHLSSSPPNLFKYLKRMYLLFRDLSNEIIPMFEPTWLNILFGIQYFKFQSLKRNSNLFIEFKSMLICTSFLLFQ